MRREAEWLVMAIVEQAGEQCIGLRMEGVVADFHGDEEIGVNPVNHGAFPRRGHLRG